MSEHVQRQHAFIVSQHGQAIPPWIGRVAAERPETEATRMIDMSGAKWRLS
jgi:hypothetical protein